MKKRGYGKVRPYNVVCVNRKTQSNADIIIELAERIGAKVQASRNGQKVTITFSDVGNPYSSKFKSPASQKLKSQYERQKQAENLENIRQYSAIILK